MGCKYGSIFLFILTDQDDVMKKIESLVIITVCLITTIIIPKINSAHVNFALISAVDNQVKKLEDKIQKNSINNKKNPVSKNEDVIFILGKNDNSEMEIDQQDYDLDHFPLTESDSVSKGSQY